MLPHSGNRRQGIYQEALRTLARLRPRRPGLLVARMLALLLTAVLVAPVYAAGRQNVDVVWSNDAPLGGYNLGDFDGDGRTDLFRVVGTQWQFSSAGVGPWQDLLNDPTPQSELRFGDFNGDGRTDVFSRMADGRWRYSPGGAGAWVMLALDPTPITELRFGDFNGDGRTDVFGIAPDGRWRYSPAGEIGWINLGIDSLGVNDLRFGFFDDNAQIDVFSRQADGRWRFSSGGVASWLNLNIDPAPLSELALGDFDGDGFSDVFNRMPSGQWRYSSRGLAGWVNLASDPLPLSDLRFGDFDGDNRTDVFSIGPGGIPRYSSGGVAPWQNLTPGGPPTATPTPTPTAVPPTTPITALAFGDFDGDGVTDVFRSNGGQWQFSARGVGEWVNLAFDPLPLSELRFGDFNGDCITDVFSIAPDGRWRYSAGGRTPWIDLAIDNLPVGDLRFGDFDGDGRTDLFSRAADGRWRYSSGGATPWIDLSIDPIPLSELRLGDFNGDGRTDVFSIAPDGRWRYAPGGLLPWVDLRLDTLPIGELRFGDFDGDGRTDVFNRMADGRWRYSSAGLGDWVDLAFDPLPLTELRFGDFNGDRRTDVFSIGPDGRWRYSDGGQSNWILLGPPGSVTVTPIPTGTLTPTGCPNILDNGDFEMNHAWTFGHSPIPGKYSGLQKRSGLRSVLLGNAPESNEPLKASYSSIRQLVSVPPYAATVTLRWSRLAHSEKGATVAPSSTQDRHEVILLTPGGKTLKILQRTRYNDTAWQTDALDLTEFAGASFYIYFNVYNDGTAGRTWMYLDDVRLEVCAGPHLPRPMPRGATDSPGFWYGPGGYDVPPGYPPAVLRPGPQRPGPKQPGKGPYYPPPPTWTPTWTPTPSPTPTATQEGEPSPTPTETPQNDVGPGGEEDMPDKGDDEPIGADGESVPDFAGEPPADQGGSPDAVGPAAAALGAPLTQAVSTPRPTAPISAECIELLNNGNFEVSDTGWTVLYSPVTPAYVDEPTFNRSRQAMRLGAVEPITRSAISAIDQIVTLPDDATSVILSLRYYPLIEGEAGSGDLQYVDIYNAITGQFAGRVLGLQSDERAWLTTDYDLTPLLGQTIRLVIAVNNDGEGGHMAMVVDNVSIVACTFTNLVNPAEPGEPASIRGITPQGDEDLAARSGQPWRGRLGAFSVLAGILAAIGFATTIIVQTMRRPG